jgi:hypothetical protein
VLEQRKEVMRMKKEPQIAMATQTEVIAHVNVTTIYVNLHIDFFVAVWTSGIYLAQQPIATPTRSCVCEQAYEGSYP